ncbi:MAG: helix-turn-helix domain-containing protein [Gemmatimonadetes bacterium]|nr:helix-turn-helix domain-containing protein [Gemmatimonadota bacterium]
MPDLLTAKQIAEYLQLSQRSIYRLLERGELPATKIGGQWRFRKAAIDEWIDLHMGRLAPEELRQLSSGARDEDVRLGNLIDEANALIPVPAGDRATVIRRFVDQIRFPEPIDLVLLVERILERENLCSTALPDGVALLHTPRTTPRVLKLHDLVALGRIERPVPFGALDGSLTDSLVLLLARDERHHLALLAKMARLCREPDVLHGLRTLPTAAAIADLIRRSEEAIFTVPVASR